MTQYPSLFSPGRIGSMTLKNRGVMMPMATEQADRYGVPTLRQIRYYQERAKGGVAMIINEYTGVDDVDSIPAIHNLRAAQDYHIAELEKLTDAVHLYDCKIVAQLHHGGATSSPALTGRENLAPSAVPIADGRPVPREMTLEDIRRIQQKFIAAAVRCKKAGYDAVELHGAHGYLIAQFFSKYYNRRTDEYGGSVENRCRFLSEIIAGIRKELGRFPILVRMCGDEMTPVDGFLTLEDGLEIAKHLEACGIDAINISNGSARNGDANCEPFSYQPGWKKHVAKAYKAALHIPVIATNTIKDPDFAESLLAEGVCDFVGLGRSQLADPEFMNKARAGKADEIRNCIGCLYCRERVLGGSLPIRCAVNPRTGREVDFPHLKRNGGGKTVVVAGGGPAGMEAARDLALRDFRVVLMEQDARLGGTLNIAAIPPFKDKLAKLAQTMARQMEVLGVEVRLNTAATVENVKAENPVGVILACGAEPLMPPLPGMDLPHVMTAERVLTGEAMPEGTVAVVGSGLTGLETAEVLLERGHSVALVEMLPNVGPGVFPAILNDELSRIDRNRTQIYTSHKLLSIAPGEITLERLADSAKVTVKADSVVLAMGVRPKPMPEFDEAFDKVIRIGDARTGGRIATAVRQGFEAAYIF
ncbi:MAG: FAD-dependent oxidoreductase [Oscillibacter sp.]|nr:FAD-dependent oxidoreductase [Oscillibacter sp.]